MIQATPRNVLHETSYSICWIMVLFRLEMTLLAATEAAREKKRDVTLIDLLKMLRRRISQNFMVENVFRYVVTNKQRWHQRQVVAEFNVWTPLESSTKF